MPEYEYIVRWKNSKKQVREASEPTWTIQDAVEYANAICKNWETEVVVIENGSLICIVSPD